MDNKLIIFIQWFFIWKRLLLYPIAFGVAEYLNLHFEIRITKILVTIVPQEARISRTLKNVYIKIIYSLKIRKRKFGFLLNKLLSEGTSNCNNHIFHNWPALSKVIIDVNPFDDSNKQKIQPSEDKGETISSSMIQRNLLEEMMAEKMKSTATVI